jgi:hypothetical protein
MAYLWDEYRAPVLPGAEEAEKAEEAAAAAQEEQDEKDAEMKISTDEVDLYFFVYQDPISRIVRTSLHRSHSKY